jgi:hypothetical protein
MKTPRVATVHYDYQRVEWGPSRWGTTGARTEGVRPVCTGAQSSWPGVEFCAALSSLTATESHNRWQDNGLWGLAITPLHRILVKIAAKGSSPVGWSGRRQTNGDEEVEWCEVEDGVGGGVLQL